MECEVDFFMVKVVVLSSVLLFFGGVVEIV